ncbi:hypothetical protein [Singulisphaera acidiphila]|uniref:DUF4488 domain-containing protein n=1 Tax=Singulisphaera acidiphila (strain ATCC BAA-1392 / DSM 18658 / VKM B-2454 / MOB10) TaxID=886293 RepID=L0D654_SINAD|nr:hypothetical protein [Singulisphaera acidiphila]AGA24742.1 hypothetical protein Sinac_0295 [Singulisphaera acidiphila DSM 18658]
MNRACRMAGIHLMAFSVLALTALAEDNTKSIEGAWRQVEQKNGDAKEYQRFPAGTEMTTCIVGGRFIWTVDRGGKVLGVAGGRYQMKNDKWSETIDYVSGPGVPTSFVGSTFDFTVKVTGDTCTKVGTVQVNGQAYKIDEKWERCKP